MPRTNFLSSIAISVEEVGMFVNWRIRWQLQDCRKELQLLQLKNVPWWKLTEQNAKNTMEMGKVLFISSQQGGFTPVNFGSTSSDSGNITNVCSNKSHLKKKWL